MWMSVYPEVFHIINPLNAELNPICHLLALLGGATIVVVSRLRVNVYSLTLSLIFFPPGATQPILGVYFTALYRALASSRTRLLDHTQRRATVGRTPLNE